MTGLAGIQTNEQIVHEEGSIVHRSGRENIKK